GLIERRLLDAARVDGGRGSGHDRQMTGAEKRDVVCEIQLTRCLRHGLAFESENAPFVGSRRRLHLGDEGRRFEVLVVEWPRRGEEVGLLAGGEELLALTRDLHEP